MSKVTVETTITRHYLRGRTKDDIIEHVMRLLQENDELRLSVQSKSDLFNNHTAEVGDWLMELNVLLGLPPESMAKDIIPRVDHLHTALCQILPLLNRREDVDLADATRIAREALI